MNKFRNYLFKKILVPLCKFLAQCFTPKVSVGGEMGRMKTAGKGTEKPKKMKVKVEGL